MADRPQEVLVDTARHFQPVATLKAFIKSLTYGEKTRNPLWFVRFVLSLVFLPDL